MEEFGHERCEGAWSGLRFETQHIQRRLTQVEVRLTQVEERLDRTCRVTRYRDLSAATKELEERVGNTLDRALTIFQLSLAVVGYLAALTDIPCQARHFFSHICYGLSFMILVSTFTKVWRLVHYRSYFEEFFDEPPQSSTWIVIARRSLRACVAFARRSLLACVAFARRSLRVCVAFARRQHYPGEQGHTTTHWESDHDVPLLEDGPPGASTEPASRVPSAWSYTSGAIVQVIILGLLGIGLCIMLGRYLHDWKCANNNVDRQQHLGYRLIAT